MGPPTVSLALVLVLGTTLPAGPTMVHAERRSGLDEDTCLNRMESRLDGIERAISDLKLQFDAMNKNVEKALTDCAHQDDLSTARPHTTTQPDLSTALPDTTTQQEENVTEEPQVYLGCEDALQTGQYTSGVYTIAPRGHTTYNVYCEQRLDGGGWTVFQVRKDGSINFRRDWNAYKQGFGDLTGEFWLGNDIIHSLTKHHDQQLRIELTSPEGEVKYAKYEHFWIEDEAEKYKLKVTEYSGGKEPGDALEHNNGQKFSTTDQDNDLFTYNCADEYMGAWWYSKSCGKSNLNGVYANDRVWGKRVFWSTWLGYGVSMNATRMMFKKTDY